MLRLTVISGEIPNPIKFPIYILFGFADFSYSTLFLGSNGNWQVQYALFFFFFSSFNLVLSPSYVSSVVDHLARPFISEMNLLCILALPSLC